MKSIEHTLFKSKGPIYKNQETSANQDTLINKTQKHCHPKSGGVRTFETYKKSNGETYVNIIVDCIKCRHMSKNLFIDVTSDKRPSETLTIPSISIRTLQMTPTSSLDSNPRRLHVQFPFDPPFTFRQRLCRTAHDPHAFYSHGYQISTGLNY